MTTGSLRWVRSSIDVNQRLRCFPILTKLYKGMPRKHNAEPAAFPENKGN